MVEATTAGNKKEADAKIRQKPWSDSLTNTTRNANCTRRNNARGKPQKGVVAVVKDGIAVLLERRDTHRADANKYIHVLKESPRRNRQDERHFYR